MKDQGFVRRASEWCYHGIWGAMTKLLLVPETPPNLPDFDGGSIEYLRPSSSFLEYRKFFFWIGLFVIDFVLIVLWIIFSIWSPWWGLITAPLWLIVIVLPEILAYIMIHLAYDTTWYVFSDRTMRIRRGISTIHETTITFENVQNVNIMQGPIQRWFGFANLIVSTAGGGDGHQGSSLMSHVGWLEGIDNANQLRERILAKCQHTAGLGDEDEQAAPVSNNSLGFSRSHLKLLREIHDLTAQRSLSRA